MSLPHFASFPDAQVRKNISTQDWQLYLDSWTSLSDLYLQLDDQKFKSAISDNEDLATFILTFSHEHVRDTDSLPQLQALRKRCFLLLHRLLIRAETPSALLTWNALADFCYVYSKSEQFRALLHSAWSRNALVIEKSLQTVKNSLTRNLDSKRPEEAESTLDRIAPLLKVSPDASSYMLTGSDFLDALTSAYQNVDPTMQKKLTTVAYLGLTALLEGSKPNYSLLSDHLYSLKTNEQQEQKSTPGKKTLVADLVTITPLLDKIRDNVAAPEAARLKNTAAAIRAFRQSGVARPKRLIRRKVDKGKSKAGNDEFGHGAFSGELHVHRMSMVTQIQDLFPDLGAGFIVKLLDEYNEDIEQVTAHLLEDSLPPHLANADRSEQIPNAPARDPITYLPPRSSQHLPERRNIFDDDEFDKLAVDAARLHIGRRGTELTADKILSDRSKAPAKSSILAALAAFDSDDDERDDTYDVEDVGASVDTATPGPDEADADLRDKNEEALFHAFSMSPDSFGRDSDTRKSKARAALKSETGMTDEAIEGWAIMIRRDPKRLRRLEAKFSQFTGQQHELASTSWRDSPAGSGDETGEASGDAGAHRGGRGRGGRGRGRGSRGGRGGGNVSGPTDDRTTQVARQRKDANKASRANHNRKDQRGKKLARGGFSG